MEVSTLRKEIEKCMKVSYINGEISHLEYKKDIETIDEIMAFYFSKYYNQETGEYE